MLNYIDPVMFAIQAAIKLGRKIQTVFEDETRDRQLPILPAGGTQPICPIPALSWHSSKGRAKSMCKSPPQRRRGEAAMPSGPLSRSLGPT